MLIAIDILMHSLGVLEPRWGRAPISNTIL